MTRCKKYSPACNWRKKGRRFAGTGNDKNERKNYDDNIYSEPHIFMVIYTVNLIIMMMIHMVTFVFFIIIDIVTLFMMIINVVILVFFMIEKTLKSLQKAIFANHRRLSPSQIIWPGDL